MEEMKNRLFESGQRNLVINIPNTTQNSKARRILLEHTLLYKATRLGSSNGKYPAIRTKRITPQDHISDAVPS